MHPTIFLPSPDPFPAGQTMGNPSRHKPRCFPQSFILVQLEQEITEIRAEHPLQVLNKRFEKYIYSRKEKCTEVPIYAIPLNAHIVMFIYYKKQAIYGYYQKIRTNLIEHFFSQCTKIREMVVMTTRTF